MTVTQSPVQVGGQCNQDNTGRRGDGLESLVRLFFGTMAHTEMNESARKAAGAVKGRHFTEYVEEVKALKRAGDIAAAIKLLLRLVDAVEAESKVAGQDWPIAPWYYEQLALIYRKEKQYQSEVAILQRYAAQHETKTDSPIAALMMRLEKAQALAQK